MPEITSVSHDCDSGWVKGDDILKVTLVGSPDMEASFDLGEIYRDVPIFDDGNHDDGATGDGTYGGSVRIRESEARNDLVVTGKLVYHVNGRETSADAPDHINIDNNNYKCSKLL